MNGNRQGIGKEYHGFGGIFSSLYIMNERGEMGGGVDNREWYFICINVGNGRLYIIDLFILP